MNLIERNELVKLYDLYGSLLSKKQNEFLGKMLNLDVGESEIAALYNESRQSVHDAVAKAKSQLFEFESSCKFNKFKKNLREEIFRLKKLADENKISKLKEKIDEIAENL